MAETTRAVRAQGLLSSLATEATVLEARHGLESSNATLHSNQSAGLARVLQRLLRGQTVRVFVVGGSAAAGAGGVGVNGTFDARLVASFNRLLARVEKTRSLSPLGRLVRMNVAQGGTTSFWAGLMAEPLHSRRAHLLLWEYAINDHAVSLEAASKVAGGTAAAALSTDSMRFMMEYWLRRVASLRPPPALLLTYLWDKQPGVAFKPGNRALCRKLPVPASAFRAQRSTLEHYRPLGGGMAALDVAGYVSEQARGSGGSLCPLVADAYYHPSDKGHQLVSELLMLLLLRRMLAEGIAEAAPDASPQERRSASISVRVPSTASRQPIAPPS
jgi:hypothetical protein